MEEASPYAALAPRAFIFPNPERLAPHAFRWLYRGMYMAREKINMQCPSQHNVKLGLKLFALNSVLGLPWNSDSGGCIYEKKYFGFGCVDCDVTG